MYLQKESVQKSPEKDLAGFENLPGLTIEYDSCCRGKMEIWKDKEGNVVRIKIIR
jgi:hypothetical protein